MSIVFFKSEYEHENHLAERNQLAYSEWKVKNKLIIEY